MASDGPVNGRFTEVLLKVRDNGSFSGGYRAFDRDILRRMPADQSPSETQGWGRAALKWEPQSGYSEG
ncbi:hypothetical protein OG735_02895 [Streptomyces sp. NBC_01210]|uniref:hypothetical protein n=1 Tax=Streptomyces sp. NBC_01210 TaxID=2903774 RepID=UPI002E0F95E3|nr:hypothetical protein OG735_02895 [Streptomyces sp. NBC_01210]